MNRTTLRALLISLTLILAISAAQRDAHAAALSCETVPKFMNKYLGQHIRHRQLTPELRTRTIGVFLRSFDPSQSMMLESEIEAMKAQLLAEFSKIENGGCSAISTVHQKFAQRQKEIATFVKDFVSAENYAIDMEVEIIIDAKKRGYPKTVAERDQLTRNLVHFQMSNYVSDVTPLEEAKELLEHRYELRTKRIADLDSVDLYSNFLYAFATSLDPHSNYFSAEMYEDFRISMSLSLIGIGVALSERDGFAVVERIIPGGAADALDVLKQKDKIIEVGQGDEKAINIIDMPLRDSVGLIRGKKGTTVKLTILRQAESTERFTVAIVREEISLEGQAAALRFEEREVDGETLKLAILELPSFYGDSGNGGGLLNHAVTVSGFFLSKGEIVKVQDVRGQEEVLSDRDESILYAGPLVVHTSRVSASAAEILAGALKDYKRAVIAGDDHTFGKGTVQTVQSLPPGLGALKITTAMFYRPGGKSTQHDGVEADVVIPSTLSGDDFGEKHQPFSIEGNSINAFRSSYAIANTPTNSWAVVNHEMVEKLASESKRRIDASSDFAEVYEKLAEYRENAGVIRPADLVEQREEEREEELEEEREKSTDSQTTSSTDDPNGDAETADQDAGDRELEEEEEEEISPQLAEATNVLVDLIAFKSSSQSTAKTRGMGTQ
ncbi:MAG: carboxy terminal-processing peptidase [Deltaproteobacteria bacterium]|nr:carboxy terminal-processing peptidase [Deltaproteobacteria bacterium]